MNITVELKSLRPAVSAAAKLTRRAYGEKGVTLTAEGSTLHIGARDADVTLSIRVPATVREAGAVTVEAAALLALVKGKGAVILSDAQDGFLRVENGIATDLPVSALPVAPVAEWADRAHTVDLGTVADVAVAASRDEARPILTGILFDGAAIVASDSYRLHWAEVGETFPTLLVPSRAFAFLPKTGAAYLTAGKTSRPGTPYATYADGVRTVTETTITEERVRIETDAVTVTVRLIDGEFPNWRQLIRATQPHALTVEREAFGKVVAAVGAVIAKSANPLRLKVDGSELVVWAQVDGRDASSGRVPVKGDDLELFPEIAFNPGFLSDAVSTVHADMLTLTVTDSLKPAAIREGRTVRLLMPVRVS